MRKTILTLAVVCSLSSCSTIGHDFKKGVNAVFGPSPAELKAKRIEQAKIKRAQRAEQKQALVQSCNRSDHLIVSLGKDGSIKKMLPDGTLCPEGGAYAG